MLDKGIFQFDKVGVQARCPCAPPSFRLPFALVCYTLSTKDTPADFWQERG